MNTGGNLVEKEILENAPKRVLMTADTIGGVWTYALELVRAFGKQDIKVALAAMGAPLSSDQKAEAQKLDNLDVFESDFKLEWMENPWRDVKAAGNWLLELEENLKPEVIHLNGYAHGSLPLNAPRVVVGHSCVLSWWRAVKGENAPASWEIYREKVAAGIHAADCVVAPTRAMLDALKKNHGAIRNGRVVPNGREASLFKPAAKENFVLTAGRLWDEAKNAAALEKIAPELNWKVYIAGEEKHPVARGSQTINSENVYPLGKLSNAEIAGWYARAAVYALPARYEPFGLSALEAALAGCALVLGDIPSLREIWQDGAIFVAPDDENELRKAFESLMNSDKRREELAERSRQIALRLTPERMAAGYLEIYAELISKSKSAAGRKEKRACA